MIVKIQTTVNIGAIADAKANALFAALIDAKNLEFYHRKRGSSRSY